MLSAFFQIVPNRRAINIQRMKRQTKKLQLATETVRQLHDTQLSGIIGGAAAASVGTKGQPNSCAKGGGCGRTAA